MISFPVLCYVLAFVISLQEEHVPTNIIQDEMGSNIDGTTKNNNSLEQLNL